MAADPEHFNKLIASVAPRVIDMDSVKKGLLCQLFGGVSKSTAAALGGDSTSRWAKTCWSDDIQSHNLWVILQWYQQEISGGRHSESCWRNIALCDLHGEVSVHYVQDGEACHLTFPPNYLSADY